MTPTEQFASQRKEIWQRDTLMTLGKLVRETLPDHTEETKWHMPTWFPVCYLGANKDVVYLGFFRWQELPFRLHKVFTHTRKVIARIDFAADTEIPREEIREILLALADVTATDRRPWRVH